MNVNTRMLSSAIMISLLALMGTLYVSVPIANADDIFEERLRPTSQSFVEVEFVAPEYVYTVAVDGAITEFDGVDEIIVEVSPPTQSSTEVVYLDQDYGYAVGADGTIIEEFDDDGNGWISETNQPTTREPLHDDLLEYLE